MRYSSGISPRMRGKLLGQLGVCHVSPTNETRNDCQHNTVCGEARLQTQIRRFYYSRIRGTNAVCPKTEVKPT